MSRDGPKECPGCANLDREKEVVMEATAESLDMFRVTQEVGVVERAGDTLHVATSGGRLLAKRAVSCLVEPEDSDRVLVAVSDAGRAWVLAVLERESTSHRLVLDGDIALEARGGSVRVEADEDVRVAAKGELGFLAKKVELHAVEGKAFFERFAWVGGLVRADVKKVETVARVIDQVVDRVTQRAKRSFRFVEEMDVHQAHQIDVRAEKTYSVRSHNTLMTSEALHKVDADQIHLG